MPIEGKMANQNHISRPTYYILVFKDRYVLENLPETKKNNDYYFGEEHV